MGGFVAALSRFPLAAVLRGAGDSAVPVFTRDALTRVVDWPALVREAGSLHAAKSLFGATSPKVEAVGQAWTLVGVGSPEAPPKPNPTPTPTPKPNPTPTPTPTPPTNAVSAVGNGGFETSASPWTFSGSAFFTREGTIAHAGSGYAILGTSTSSDARSTPSVSPRRIARMVVPCQDAGSVMNPRDRVGGSVVAPPTGVACGRRRRHDQACAAGRGPCPPWRFMVMSRSLERPKRAGAPAELPLRRRQGGQRFP